MRSGTENRLWNPRDAMTEGAVSMPRTPETTPWPTRARLPSGALAVLTAGAAAVARGADLDTSAGRAARRGRHRARAADVAAVCAPGPGSAGLSSARDRSAPTHAAHRRDSRDPIRREGARPHQAIRGRGGGPPVRVPAAPHQPRRDRRAGVGAHRDRLGRRSARARTSRGCDPVRRRRPRCRRAVDRARLGIDGRGTLRMVRADGPHATR